MPRFPIGLPPLAPDAPPLSDADRAYVAGLPERKRREAEHSLRLLAAPFARAKLAADKRRTDAVEQRRQELAA